MLKNKKIDVVNIVLTFVFVVLAIVVVYPFYSSILISFMTEKELALTPIPYMVKEPTLAAYRELFSGGKIPTGYKNTFILIFTVVPLHMVVNSAIAYSLSRKSFLFSKTINNMVVLTMYFGGGLIPAYLLIKNLGIMNSLWAVILPMVASPYNMILIKSFFYTIPDSLEESAKLDGANDLTIYARIYIPLALPILATVFLFICVGTWNQWYQAMLYLNDEKKWPIQLVLRNIINTTVSEAANADIADQKVFPQSIKMASLVVTMAPIMVLYPFLQKYFMSGLTVGAVKG